MVGVCMTSGNGMATEQVVRNALRGHLCSDSDGQEMVEEFWVPRSNERADLVVIGPTLDGFEIKTERDTLRRLPRQAVAYARVFDRCTAVVAERHRGAVTDLLPEWWGVIVIHAEPSVAFVRVRPPKANPSVDTETIVRLLWRDEAMSALLRLGRQPDQHSPRCSLWQELLETANPVQLQAIVRQAIVGRDPGRARIRTRRFTTQSTAAEAGS